MRTDRLTLEHFDTATEPACVVMVFETREQEPKSRMTWRPAEKPSERITALEHLLGDNTRGSIVPAQVTPPKGLTLLVADEFKRGADDSAAGVFILRRDDDKPLRVGGPVLALWTVRENDEADQDAFAKAAGKWIPTHLLWAREVSEGVAVVTPAPLPRAASKG